MRQSLEELALLPRATLAERAYRAQEYRATADALWNTLVATWGDDPNAWQLPDQVRRALGDLLALHIIRWRFDHTAQSSEHIPQRDVPKRHRRRGR